VITYADGFGIDGSNFYLTKLGYRIVDFIRTVASGQVVPLPITAVYPIINTPVPSSLASLYPISGLSPIAGISPLAAYPSLQQLADFAPITPLNPIETLPAISPLAALSANSNESVNQLNIQIKN
jgi:hypothetical protein